MLPRILVQPLYSQVTAVRDTVPADTVAASQKGELEGPVKYQADQIAFSVDGRKTFLYGHVKIEYQNMTLEAGRVTIDWNRNYMVATGIADSTDSLGNPVYQQLPHLLETGNEPIVGIRLEYDFKHQRGKVLEGKTKMEPGYYRGEEIVKVGKKTLLVKNGYFTSCDSIEHPHYYFKANKMRILMNKRAVAEPITMYIADVPVFAIPFGVFPMERGRRSGLIIPKYGESSYGGRYLRDFGYYWAASDYWDATLLGTFFENTGMAYEGELRYNKRYSFSGNVVGKFAPRDVTTGQKRQRWSLQFNHSQTLGQTANLNASGTFVSDKSFFQNYSNNLQDRLNQVISTNVNFSKRWPGSKNSVNVSIRRTENLQTGDLDFTLPRISFNHTQSNLIRYNPQKSAKKHWYHNIFYNYSSNFTANGSHKLQSDSTFRDSKRIGWQHNAGLSYNGKLFKYLKYNQSARVEELWVPSYYQYHWVDSLNTALPDTVLRPRARHTFSTKIGVSTTVYGLFEIPFLPVKIIRHKMDPSVSFSFSPDFSDPRFGYVQTFTDTSGRVRTFDRFANNPYGGTSSGEARRMNFSIRNLFQGKTIKNGEEKKIDLFTWNLNTSYNFIRDSLKWSDLSSSIRAKASKDFDFTFSATHSLYKFGHNGSGYRNEYVWENGFSLPRLLRMQVNARLHLAPPAKKDKQKPGTAAAGSDTTAYRGPDITRDEITEGLKAFSLPWDVNINVIYSMDRSNIHLVRKRLDANLSAKLEITRNWRVQYTANFDLINKQINYQSFHIYRDLHCWEMSFTWAPNPAYSYFTLDIHIKESALRDIKLTKSSAGRKVY